MNVKGMSNYELLGMLLGPRTATKMSRRSLSELFEASLTSEVTHPKLLAARELVLRSLREEIGRRDALSTPSAVRDYLRLFFRGKEHEVFVAIYLDAQNRVIESVDLFRGTISATSVYPREVVKEALRHNAASVIFSHNHPSGVAEPSHADEMLTKALRQALALVDVRVLDHFVVADNTTVSFAERGLL